MDQAVLLNALNVLASAAPPEMIRRLLRVLIDDDADTCPNMVLDAAVRLMRPTTSRTTANQT